MYNFGKFCISCFNGIVYVGSEIKTYFRKKSGDDSEFLLPQPINSKPSILSRCKTFFSDTFARFKNYFTNTSSTAPMMQSQTTFFYQKMDELERNEAEQIDNQYNSPRNPFQSVDLFFPSMADSLFQSEYIPLHQQRERDSERDSERKRNLESKRERDSERELNLESKRECDSERERERNSERERERDSGSSLLINSDYIRSHLSPLHSHFSLSRSVPLPNIEETEEETT